MVFKSQNKTKNMKAVRVCVCWLVGWFIDRLDTGKGDPRTRAWDCCLGVVAATTTRLTAWSIYSLDAPTANGRSNVQSVVMPVFVFVFGVRL